MLQTNGDLLTPKRIDELLKRGVKRIDVASIDMYHVLSGSRRLELETMFAEAGMVGDDPDPHVAHPVPFVAGFDGDVATNR